MLHPVQKAHKRIIAICLGLIMALCLPLMPAFAAPSVTAQAYVVMDADSGQILFGNNMEQQYDPASITKVMTVALACQKAQGDWSVPLTVSYDDIASIANTGSSHIALQDGEVIRLEDALYAVMMVSANDAANVLAAYVGGDIAGGVAAMNAQVAALGLTNTHFDNPHGLNSDTHKVSAHDMAEIVRWALQQPGFITLFTNNETYTMAPTNLQEKERYFSLSDLVRVGSSKYYVPEVVGSKTGYTDDSRYTYVSLGQSQGRNFICVTLHNQEKVDRYHDAESLFDYAFAHFTKVEIPPNQDDFLVDVYGGDAKLGQVKVTPMGTSFYLYDGEGAQTVTANYQLSERYILGQTYDATVTYTLPETANQAGFTRVQGLQVGSIDAILEANTGISLPAMADLIPKVHRNVLPIGLGIFAIVAVVGFVLYKRRKPKRRYQRLHKYTR